MNKRQIISEVAKITGHKKAHVKDISEAMLYLLGGYAAVTGRVSWPDFGILKVVERKARSGGRNVNTGEPLQIPARKRMVFAPAKSLRAKVEKIK